MRIPLPLAHRPRKGLKTFWQGVGLGGLLGGLPAGCPCGLGEVVHDAGQGVCLPF